MSIQDKIAEREAQLKQAEELRLKREKEKQEKAERVKELKEKMKDPEYRAERKELMKHLRQERPKVRQELRDRGLRTYADYSFFCKELNLGYPEDTWQYDVDEFRANFSAWLSYLKNRINIWVVMLLIILTLLLIFLFAFISEEKGRFTVNMTAEMLRQGFELSESEDFEKAKTRLFANEITNSNAVSIYEMNRGLAEADGSHNGPGYMAYTFYIQNNGEYTVDYGYTVNILSETLNAGSAAWVMFFEDDRQIVYARATEDGPENLFGYPDPPFYDLAYDADSQYYEDWTDDTKTSKAWGIITTPFIDEYTVLQGYVSEFEPGEKKKYTMVVWVEGDDPDCNNDLLGGHIGFNISFDRLGEEKDSYFKGLFREEYEKSYWGEEEDEDETEPATRPADQESAREPEPDETEAVHESTEHETVWTP